MSTPNKHLPYAQIEFSLGDQLLVAELLPNRLQQPLTTDLVRALLNQSGYGNHELDQTMLEQFVQMSINNEATKIDIEAHIDAHFDIEIDEDQLSATLNYSPAYCGNEIDIENIKEALYELGLPDQKIDYQAIETLLNSNGGGEIVIAKGTPAVNGNDASIDIIFQTDSEAGPRRLENGQVDHYETHTYVTVSRDCQLMKRNPPTSGSPGETVFGEVIEPIPGADLDFELNETVKLDNSDPNLLLADKNGHPILKPNSVFIDDTLTLATASLETGNVHFNGSVQIKGDVKPNVKIEASGDIYVEGLVESAELISGNNITIQAGIISSTTTDDDTDEQFEYQTIIEAENDIQIKYCNSVKAIAGGSIMVENYSLHSLLKAQVDVIAGIGVGKGIIIGGEVHAENRIEANIVGSEAFVTGYLYCANTLLLKNKCLKLKHKIDRLKGELQMLNKILEQIKALGSPVKVGQVKLEKAKKIYREMQLIKKDLSGHKKTLKSYRLKMHPKVPNTIQINKTIYPNINILINDLKTQTTSTRKACVIKKSDREIEFN